MIRLSVIAFALGLVFNVSCARQEPPPAAPAGLEAAASPTAPAATAETSPGDEAGSAAAADVDEVGEKSGAFDNMLNSLRGYAGAEVEISTNRVDLASFVKGKSERDLLTFAQKSADTSPFAALQVLQYLLQHATNPDVLISAAGWHMELVPGFGDEDGRGLALEALDRIHEMYADETLAQFSDPARREWLLALLQKHVILLALDDAELLRVARAARDHGRSDVEQSYADCFEALTLLRTGREEDKAASLRLFQRIRDRNAYGTYFAQKDVVDYWLDEDDFDEHALEAKDSYAAILARGRSKWEETIRLSPEEKVLRAKTAR